MGERKGQNFYYPPDFDYKKHKSLNSYHGTHALRERAAKIGQGILIIRFEMPFNIWCLGCNNHVGMGVRYNAEKKKVGMYYTTPLYEFRMKCHLCDNYYVIRTDPEHFDYELVEGCRRQEKRYDPSTINQLGAVDRSFNRQLEGDKMFKAEHEEKDKKKGEQEGDRTEKLEWIQERMRDDFAANQALRRSFRRNKQDMKDQRAIDDDLRKRASLELSLVPENPLDARTAALLTKFKQAPLYEEQQSEKRTAIGNRPIFGATEPSEPSTSSAGKKHGNAVEILKKQRKRSANAFDHSPSTNTATLTRRDIGVKLANRSHGISSRLKEEETSKPQITSEVNATTTNASEEASRSDEVKVVPKKEDLAVLKQEGGLGLVADYTSSGSDEDSTSEMKPSPAHLAT